MSSFSLIMLQVNRL